MISRVRPRFVIASDQRAPDLLLIDVSRVFRHFDYSQTSLNARSLSAISLQVHVKAQSLVNKTIK